MSWRFLPLMFDFAAGWPRSLCQVRASRRIAVKGGMGARVRGQASVTELSA